MTLNETGHQMTINLAQGLQTKVLIGLGVIRVTGVDARSFLHGQLTQDIINLSSNDTRLAGYCSAKGRLYSVLHVFAKDDVVYLITRRSLIPSLIKRLSLFVMRAKVVFEDISNDLNVYGICSSDALSVGECKQGSESHRIGVLPFVDDGIKYARELLITDSKNLTTLPEIDEAVWNWFDIKAGMPIIELETQEAFVPQMVNLDRIGGINFKKGCYPGQEVVARSHYLGKLKRRMQAAQLSFATVDNAVAALLQLPPGLDVYSSIDLTQPAGQIVSAALNPFNHLLIDVLYEVSLPFLLDGAILSVESLFANWQRMELPYSLAD